MQRMFAEETPWHTPWLERVLPKVEAIARAHPRQTIFTRLITPSEPDRMPGAWRDYYRHWSSMTAAQLDPHLLELVSPLAALDSTGASDR
jgi:hypothetical protein